MPSRAFDKSAALHWVQPQNADKVLTQKKAGENSKTGKCWKHAWILGESGERGRNRTFNLLIKSQLLCQLSYAPTADGKVGTNFDYTIRFARSCIGDEPELCFSASSARRNLDFGRGAPDGPTFTDSGPDSLCPSSPHGTQSVTSFLLQSQYNRCATFPATLGLGSPEEKLYAMEQDCAFNAACRDHSLSGACRKCQRPSPHSHWALHRARNNETPAARTLLGGCGRFQIGLAAASGLCRAGAPGS